MTNEKARRRRPARKRKRALRQKTSREQPTELPDAQVEDVVSDDVVQVPKPLVARAPDGQLCRCPRGHPMAHTHFSPPVHSGRDYAPHQMPPPVYGANATPQFRRATGGD